MIPLPVADTRVTSHDLKPHITAYKTVNSINQKSQTQAKIQTICGSDFHVLADLGRLSGEAVRTEAIAQPSFSL